MNKNITILGGSGSIGTQCVEIIEQREHLNLIGFSFQNNVEKAKEILAKNKNVKYIATKKENAKILQKEFKNITFFTQDDKLEKLAQIKVHLVVVATVGFSGLKPSLSAIHAKNDIAFANKECIVSGGELLFNEIEKHKINYFTMDSEHSAIEQCLNGENLNSIKKLILTASGGPFLNKNKNQLENVTLEEVINHPNWNMGMKISIDSANMANKILEVIEAHYLFNVKLEDIKIVIQPTSIVHSMVEFKDHSIIAQMSKPSMLLPISYCLEGKKREVINNYQSLDFDTLTKLEFKKVEPQNYPMIEVLNILSNKPKQYFNAFNALNEYFNFAFQNKKISFLDISKLVVKELNQIEIKKNNTIEDIINQHQQIIELMEQKYEFNMINN